MGRQPEISQRDLRLRSKDIMDSVENGQSFTVTRDGHQIAELIPLRRRRTFVPREEFLSGPPVVEPVDVDRFRADLEAYVDDELSDPHAG
jgi:antitoxin (DNA-binding transcriptional repressor) of toxin-antitoxin stability system